MNISWLVSIGKTGSFMNIIMAKRMCLFSWNLSEWWPYNYKLLSSIRWSNRLAASTFEMEVLSFCLGNKKCLVSSRAQRQSHQSLGVWRKLFVVLWCLRGLKPTLNWSRCLPCGSCVPNVDFGIWRIRLKIFFLKVSNEGQDWKLMSMLLHDQVEFGKNLFMYLSVLHDISKQ